MNGNRKVEMLKRTQWLAFALTVFFMLIKAYVGAPELTPQVLLFGLIGVGVNFGAFVAGNVMGDHGKKDAPASPPQPQ